MFSLFTILSTHARSMDQAPFLYLTINPQPILSYLNFMWRVFAMKNCLNLDKIRLQVFIELCQELWASLSFAYNDYICVRQNLRRTKFIPLLSLGGRVWESYQVNLVSETAEILRSSFWPESDTKTAVPTPSKTFNLEIEFEFLLRRPDKVLYTYEPPYCSFPFWANHKDT